ncbi:adenylate/guanylate cyclase domain-containing protein [Mycobacterium sp. E740]|uniref:AAA family ATPase n=1 Tax=Mycobacterium sp. E740 TaxID=1834149 RepID=UPI0007FD03EB|nr:adenylate/guanylate cyclase domain-containing protein [Mycobacterium sp. E740]OBI77513.1 cyclase [Mycobacterium sp. E740]
MDEARCGTCGAAVGATANFCSECGAPLTREEPRAEYKQVTVLFADVVHSMAIARSVGAERLREIMAQLVDCAAAVVQRYGGTVDKFTGDGIMAVFGAPVALEDHAVRACLAALGIQAEMHAIADGFDRRDGIRLQLRIGLNSGQVIAGEIGSGALGYTAVGEHVGLAQRMESVAPPGGVMLSVSTVRLVESVVTLDPPELVRIKGQDDPITARRLVSIGRQHGPLRSETELVGRRWEMSALEGLLDRAIDGQGAVVGVSGPPGIGKSRLTRELTATALSRGVPVYTTACESHTTRVPFRVVARLLRAATGVEHMDAGSARVMIEAGTFPDAGRDDVVLLEDVLGIADPSLEPPRIDPDSRRRRLIALVNSAALATQTPAVYIIEDAHWIDESSESMLAAFLTVIPQTPLLTVITYRPEYRGSLTQVPGTQTIALGPLNDAETADLVTTLLGQDPSVRQLTQTVVQKAVGTPFFAEEIIRDLVERGVLQGHSGTYSSSAEPADVSVPATLQATIAARIDRLDPVAKRTLNAASVVGSRFGTDLLKALDIEPRPGDLLTAQLIDQVTFTDEPEFVFHHPLIRAVAYEAQLKSDRAELHRRVAAAIERRSAGNIEENAALIAEHAEAAGDLRAAFGWHMRAAGWSNNRDVSAALLSWESACRVADALPEDDPERSAMRIAPRTFLCASGWRMARECGTRFEELRELCELTGDKASLAVGMMGPISDLHFRGETRESSRLATEQMALLESIGDPGLAAQAAFGAIGIKIQNGELADGLRWAESTIEWAAGDLTKGSLVVGSPLAIATALRGLAGWWFGRQGWRDDVEAAFALAAESNEPLTIALTTSWNLGLGVAFGAVACDGSAVAKAEATLRTAESFSYGYAGEIARYVLGGQLIYQATVADWDRGIQMITQVRDAWTQNRTMLVEVTFMDALVGLDRANRGDFSAAIPLIRGAAETMFARRQYTYWIPVAGFLVDALLKRNADGDTAEAAAAIDELERAPLEGAVIRDIWLLRLRALLANARGDDTAYRELRERYWTMADDLGYEGHQKWAAVMP